MPLGGRQSTKEYDHEAQKGRGAVMTHWDEYAKILPMFTLRREVERVTMPEDMRKAFEREIETREAMQQTTEEEK